MENLDKIIVLVIVFVSAFITWKVIKDFYITKFHKVYAHLIAVITSCFMLLSTMFLFAPKNYQRGQTPEVDLSFISIASVFAMVAVIYILFKYIPSKNK
ncbi:hypothetical protein CPU12_13000 [Malaciobacter molluscorum LMG 25693]|uniref:Membrane protein n=1 Tax=Malaciobacter molluscorum LMG 25693 TaxID=870501 RepID=A0A2G1DEP1_9BACT|nr:hypothetical protein [Malaciobacter molluscorum]AXX93073.1 putative membrane protein [Malaciobacter molluscorum LMG 25693]PHO16959.1 hypothetical protein CPU12_13000 [Malaciobacter molluscorum LMG 25693]RXJ95543.1 hypothetical protein CRV00_03620 [Malaciobacter molluscorum]